MNSFHVALSILFWETQCAGGAVVSILSEGGAHNVRLKNPDLETRVWFADIFLLLEIHQFLLTLFCSLL